MNQQLVLQTVTPLLVVIFLFVGLRLLIGALGHRDRLSAATFAVPVGFLVGYFLILGGPQFPPIAAQQKIFWVALAGALIGLGLDIAGSRVPRWVTILTCFLWPAAIVAWLGLEAVQNIDYAEAERNLMLYAPLAGVVGTWLAGVIGLLQLRRTRPETQRDLATPIMLVIAAAGAGALALSFDTGSTAQLSFALAAATGGFLLVNYGTLLWKPELIAPAGWTMVLGAGGALIAVVLSLGLTTKTSFWALAFLLPIFFADMFWAGRPKRNHIVARILRPILLFATALIPAMVLIYVVIIIRQLTGE